MMMIISYRNVPPKESYSDTGAGQLKARKRGIRHSQGKSKPMHSARHARFSTSLLTKGKKILGDTGSGYSVGAAVRSFVILGMAPPRLTGHRQTTTSVRNTWCKGSCTETSAKGEGPQPLQLSTVSASCANCLLLCHILLSIFVFVYFVVRIT